MSKNTELKPCPYQSAIDQILNSYNAQRGYILKLFTREELEKLKPDLEKMKDVISDNAIIGYEKGLFHFVDLMKLTSCKIGLLTSENALIEYEEKIFTLADLEQLTSDKIKIVTSNSAMDAFVNGNIKFNMAETSSVALNTLELATSSKVVEGYKNNTFTFSDIIKLTSDKIELISENMKAFTNGYVTFNVSEMASTPTPTLELALSSGAQEEYQYEVVGFSNMVKLTSDRIINVTSKDAVSAFKNHHVDFDVSKIASMSPEVITVVLSKGATENSSLGFFTLLELEVLLPRVAAMAVLSSEDAKMAYEEGVKFDEIKNLPLKEINAIIYPFHYYPEMGYPPVAVPETTSVLGGEAPNIFGEEVVQV